MPAKTFLDWNKRSTFLCALKNLCRHFWGLCRHFFVPAIWVPDAVLAAARWPLSLSGGGVASSRLPTSSVVAAAVLHAAHALHLLPIY
jgi:hypothetical protein